MTREARMFSGIILITLSGGVVETEEFLVLAMLEYPKRSLAPAS